MNVEQFHLRQAEAEDEQFVMALAERFVGFELPAWRKRNECLVGIRDDLLRNLDDPPPTSWLYVAEDEAGERVGYLHLQKLRDFFTGRLKCHISDLATTPDAEGRGVGRTMLRFSEDWAREHKCALITLGVFPGNQRALAFYRASGFDTDLLLMAKPVKDARRP